MRDIILTMPFIISIIVSTGLTYTTSISPTHYLIIILTTTTAFTTILIIVSLASRIFWRCTLTYRAGTIHLTTEDTRSGWANPETFDPDF